MNKLKDKNQKHYRYVEELTSQDIGRAVMNDMDRPCLFGVAGPCFHPKCLDSYYETLKNETIQRREDHTLRI